MQRSTCQYTGAWWWLAPLILLVLSGCSSSWKAPLEVRDQRPAGQPQYGTISSSSYTVRKGDTLYSLAWRSGKDFRQLASWNGIRPPYTIYPGQTLRLSPPPARHKTASTGSRPKPASKTTAAPRKPAKQASAGTSGQTAKTTRKKNTGKAPATSVGALHWAWPTSGRVVGTFAANDHARQGLKISGKEGQPIRAAERGRVVYSGSGLVGYGRLIIIKHNDKYLSAYGHNRRLLVKEGEQVSKGQRIAEMGHSNDGKPVLHFEIRRVGKPVDPLRLLPRR